MNDAAQISVIIPTRNRGAVLERCLECLARQDGKSFGLEVIVVDDCSSDETADRVARLVPSLHLPVRFFRQPKPSGANAARNRGVREARGEIVVFLDDDAFVPDGWLQALLTGFQTAGMPVATGPVRLQTEGKLPGRHRNEAAIYLADVPKPVTGPNGELVPLLCLMVGFRHCFQRTKFDEAVQAPNEEIDWLLRAKLTVAFLPDAWIWHHKEKEEVRRFRLLRLAWRRGGETGRWCRERLGLSFHQRIEDARQALRTAIRAYAHGLLHMCWGGLLIGASQTSRSLALLGLSRRKSLPKEVV